jgi:hypothetical protein
MFVDKEALWGRYTKMWSIGAVMPLLIFPFISQIFIDKYSINTVYGECFKRNTSKDLILK